MIEEIKDISLLKDLFDKYKDNYDPIINDYTKIYAYKIDNKYVSFIVAQILYENAEIIDVFTLEEYRRRGIAKELMHKIIDDEQVKNITLEVNINNKNAILMYNSLGFKETTIRKGYYNGEDAFLMLKKKYKYIIFDIGKVLVGSKEGRWYLTPMLLDLTKGIEKEKVIEVLQKYWDLVRADKPIKTLEEEYNMFVEYYSKVLEELNLDTSLSKDIAYDKVYTTNEYFFYDDVKRTIERLKDNYTLLILSDNFPSIYNYLKEYGIYDMFDKIYISSEHGTSKFEDKFFKILINDYNIKKGEALFIDDGVAKIERGFNNGLDVVLLDRENNKESKFNKITSLDELEV